MNRRYHLERHLTELQSIITNHESGRKLLSTEEEYHRHLKFVHGLQRKLATLTTTTTNNNDNDTMNTNNYNNNNNNFGRGA